MPLRGKDKCTAYHKLLKTYQKFMLISLSFLHETTKKQAGDRINTNHDFIMIICNQ